MKLIVDPSICYRWKWSISLKDLLLWKEKSFNENVGTFYSKIFSF